MKTTVVIKKLSLYESLESITLKIINTQRKCFVFSNDKKLQVIKKEGLKKKIRIKFFKVYISFEIKSS